MGITQLNFAGKNKTEVAISRLQQHEPLEGYHLSFSGGKDSVVIESLVTKSGVKFDTHYNLTRIDPPELVQFIKKYYPNVIIEKPTLTLFEGTQIHGLPRRQSRWCCEEFKEWAGSGRRVITGIRWQESARRKTRGMVEVCRTDNTKIFIHPIIDWTKDDVWEYIHTNNIPYCSLYDEGFKRLGCVLCPMETPKQTQIELLRFPKIADMWKRACYAYYQRGTEGTKRWSNAEEMWQWWLSRKGEPKVNEAQCIMFDN
jgi:phosphoadenosine phosphosulfate reductase